MKKYKTFENLMDNESSILQKYVHTLQLYEPYDKSEYKTVFYIEKPDIYVCVSEETNEEYLNALIGVNTNG